MKMILILVGAILAVVLALMVLQSCNTAYMQAEAMREMAVAQGETAKAAQQAANSANTLAWTLGGSVLLLALTMCAIVGLVIFLRVRRELDGQAARQVQQVGPRMLTRPEQPQQLPAGDAMQTVQQLMLLQMMREMQRDARQTPVTRVALPAGERTSWEDEEDWL